MGDPSTGLGTGPAPPRKHVIRRLYDWVLSWSETRFGGIALFILAFAEASFFPIPPDVLQIALSLARPRQAFRYAAISTTGSVLGGLFGYMLGAALLRPLLAPLVAAIGLDDEFARAATLYHRYDFWAVFIAGFTPIPYKVFTILGGFVGIDLGRFVVASITSRGLRFFLVGSLLRFFGERVRTFIERRFDLLTVVFTVLLVGGFLVLGGAPAHGTIDHTLVERRLQDLDSPSADVRAQAADDLYRETGRFFGYDPYGPEDERAPAAARWRAWWEEAKRREARPADRPAP